MGIIMKEDHNKIVKRNRKFHCCIHVVLIVFIVILLQTPYIMEFGRDIFGGGYQLMKTRYTDLSARKYLLSFLRTKPMTVGQALDLIDVIMEQQDIPIPIVLGLIMQESEFNPNAISKAGARGLTQIMPDTWKIYANHPNLRNYKNMHDITLNVRIGLLYLRDLKVEYGTWKKALRVYYAGPENVVNAKYDWYPRDVLARAASFSGVAPEVF